MLLRHYWSRARRRAHCRGSSASFATPPSGEFASVISNRDLVNRAAGVPPAAVGADEARCGPVSGRRLRVRGSRVRRLVADQEGDGHSAGHPDAQMLVTERAALAAYRRQPATVGAHIFLVGGELNVAAGLPLLAPLLRQPPHSLSAPSGSLRRPHGSRSQDSILENRISLSELVPGLQSTRSGR